MKALSLRQPWANLIVQGQKDIEIRTWKTKFRGQFLIHASKGVDKEIVRIHKVDPSPSGCIVGIAELVDVKIYECCLDFNYEKHRHMNIVCPIESLPIYGFILKNIKPIRPISFRGMLNFFETGIQEKDLEYLT